MLNVISLSEIRKMFREVLRLEGGVTSGKL
jgi:hypothetical protein